MPIGPMPDRQMRRVCLQRVGCCESMKGRSKLSVFPYQVPHCWLHLTPKTLTQNVPSRQILRVHHAMPSSQRVRLPLSIHQRRQRMCRQRVCQRQMRAVQKRQHVFQRLLLCLAARRDLRQQKRILGHLRPGRHVCFWSVHRGQVRAVQAGLPMQLGLLLRLACWPGVRVQKV